jgi:hypothetical protein
MDPNPTQPGFENVPPPGQPGPAALPAAPDAIVAPSADPQAVLRLQLQTLEQRGRNGANWFWWVAGLSLVNSVVLLSGGSSYFVIGTGITLMVDAITSGIAQNSPDISTMLKLLAFGFDIVVALIAFAFGWFARKGHLLVYALGILLYLLDGLLFVLMEDWMSVGFHVFALFCMWSGFAAFRQFNAQCRAGAPEAIYSPPA